MNYTGSPNGVACTWTSRVNLTPCTAWCLAAKAFTAKQSGLDGDQRFARDNRSAWPCCAPSGSPVNLSAVDVPIHFFMPFDFAKTLFFAFGFATYAIFCCLHFAAPPLLLHRSPLPPSHIWRTAINTVVNAISPTYLSKRLLQLPRLPVSGLEPMP